MSIVAQMGETINTSMGIEQTLQILLEIVGGQVEISAGEICLWNEKQSLLEQRGWVGDPQYLLAMAEIGGAYQLGEGVAGWIAEHRKPVLLTLREDPGGFREQFKRIPYRSIVAVPLILNESLIGTLGLFHNEHNQFSQIELALLQAIAKSIALAIYNANLYTQQVQRLNDISSLQEVAEQSKNINDIGEIYALLNQRIANMSGANMSGVFLYDEVRNTLFPQLPFYGLPDSVAKAITIPLIPNSTQLNIWESQPYWISNDAVDEPLIADLGLQAIIEVAGIQNTGLFPLEIGGNRIGMIAVSNKLTEGGFTPRDIQNLRVLVAQASIVVENIRLYQREQRMDIEQIGLQEMTHVIGALSHEGEFYAEITERMGSLMGVASCGILLYAPERKALVRCNHP
jgi:GAF domain-containing protein